MEKESLPDFDRKTAIDRIVNKLIYEISEIRRNAEVSTGNFRTRRRISMMFDRIEEVIKSLEVEDLYDDETKKANLYYRSEVGAGGLPGPNSFRLGIGDHVFLFSKGKWNPVPYPEGDREIAESRREDIGRPQDGQPTKDGFWRGAAGRRKRARDEIIAALLSPKCDGTGEILLPVGIANKVERPIEKNSKTQDIAGP